MRHILLLTMIIAVSGCTVSARNYHFELVGYESKEYDDFHNIWCFTAKQSSSAIVCSAPYKARSESIGILVPVIPQANRDSRLAYDINRSRIVEFKNTDTTASIMLGQLDGIELCTGQYSNECSAKAEITIKPIQSVWLKLPSGKAHEFSISIGNKKYNVVLQEFNETRWHAVSV